MDQPTNGVQNGTEPISANSRLSMVIPEGIVAHIHHSGDETEYSPSLYLYHLVRETYQIHNSTITPDKFQRQILGTYTNLAAAEAAAGSCVEEAEMDLDCDKLYTHYSRLFLNIGVQELGVLVVLAVSNTGRIFRVRLYKTANARALRGDGKSCKVNTKLWYVFESKVVYLGSDRRETIIRGLFTNYQDAKTYASELILQTEGLNVDGFSFYKKYEVDEDTGTNEPVIVQAVDNAGTYYVVSILCNEDK
ncbi:hypothetical protein BX600DRAFT_477912 [Xylariales sp. PMI_506]|nr:hypothetical protein BX600DRAFT_477912 [Xylariales sp. PMI_506]